MDDQNIYERVSDLKTRFVKTDSYRKLEIEFNRLLSYRKAEIASGTCREARGLVVIGESGAGKTTLLRRLFETHPDLILMNCETIQADVVSLSIPSPATPKHVGLTCLTALGYPLRRDRTTSIIWEQVHHHLKMRGTMFLHLDEAQDFSNNRSVSDMEAVINTVKSLMQNRDWPVGVILSGMPVLHKLVNHDPQLSRRMTPIEMRQLDPLGDQDMIYSSLHQYCAAVKLELDTNIKSSAFIKRLIHSSAYEFGILVEFIIESIENALLRASNSLSLNDFVCAFRRRSGVVDCLNPFVIEDFEMIKARSILTNGQNEVRK